MVNSLKSDNGVTNARTALICLFILQTHIHTSDGGIDNIEKMYGILIAIGLYTREGNQCLLLTTK